MGNQYSEDGLEGTFNTLLGYYPDLRIVVQGKWSQNTPINLKSIDRRLKLLGYDMLAASTDSIHMSKKVYLDYGFISPRIFESLQLGTIFFSRDLFVPLFSKINNELELSEDEVSK